LLLRLFAQTDVAFYPPLYVTFVILAIASMLFGSWLALLQNNMKRILAYSSIAHLGFLLVAFMGRGHIQSTAAAFYLTAYFVTTLGAFGIVSLLSPGERDAEWIEDYRGLFWRRPFVAVVFSVMIFSLAGIPLTGGFVGKVLVILAGEQAAQWALVVVLVTASAISLFYYVRVVGIMYMPAEAGGADRPALPGLSLQGGGALACLTGLLVLLGVYPGPFLDLVRDMVTTVYAGVLPR
jgi:NADH-quinone oxidoreductase subunit N